MSQIGFFQLSNLVRNKVPFTLFSLDLEIPVQLDATLSSLMRGVQPFQSHNFLDHIKKMELKLEHPIVLICKDGETSKVMAQALASIGYFNVYYITGGWESLIKENI